MTLNRWKSSVQICVLEAIVVSFLALASNIAIAEHEPEHGSLLLICAGDQARTAPDFLAVINFEERSEDYGKVIATVPFPAPDATGNEPHRTGRWLRVADC